MTIMNIQELSDRCGYKNARSKYRDLIIYKSVRRKNDDANPCYEYLKDGSCDSGDCPDCVRFVIRFCNQLPTDQEISAINNRVMACSYDVKSIISYLRNLPFNIELYAHDQLYYPYAIEHEQAFRKLDMQCFLQAQYLREKQVTAGIRDPALLSSAVRLPELPNSLIAQFIGAIKLKNTPK